MLQSTLQFLFSLQALEYVFKFIVKSRLLHESLQEGKGNNEFQNRMRSLFSQLVALMEDEKNETLLIQVCVFLILNHELIDIDRILHERAEIWILSLSVEQDKSRISNRPCNIIEVPRLVRK